MSALWAIARVVVVAVGLAGVIIDGLAVTGVLQPALLGVSPGPLDEHRRFIRLLAIAPGSGADLAGLRAGDRVRYATPADLARYEQHVPGSTIRVERADGSVVSVTLTRLPLTFATRGFYAFAVAIGLLVLVLGLRAWRDPHARYLALGLLFLIPKYGAVFVDPILTRSFEWAAETLPGPCMVALVAFAVRWPSTPQRVVRLALGAGIVLGALSLGSRLVNAGMVYAQSLAGQIAMALYVATLLLVLAALGVSLHYAHGLEQRRLRWIAMSLGVGIAPLILFEILDELGHGQAVASWIFAVAFALPLGLGYAILRGRVIDVGFALNRAAVFAATTALLAGLFGGLQWAADQLLVRAAGPQNFAAQVAIAVIVLYIARLLRTRTESVVARLLFARRRRRIDAILRIATEVDAAPSPEAIPPFVVDRLRELAAIDAALYVAADDGFVRAAGTLGGDSVAGAAPIVISLRANLEPARIPPAGELGGAMVFPLAVRGQLRGGLVCALPDGDDDFAPDETAALARLATRTAIARDDLLAQALRSAVEAAEARAQEMADRIIALERENLLLQRAAGIAWPGTATAPGGVE